MASTRRVKIAEVNGEPWELELPIEDGYPSLRDLHWSASFGVFQAMLSDKPLQRLTLSFGKLGWSDPLPLLGIIAIARGAAEQARKRLDVDLGQAPSDLRRGAFLRFLAEHWFLRALWHPMQPGQLRIILDAKPSETEDQFVELERNLSRSGYLLTYDNALCLRARLFRVPIATELPLSETAKTSAVADCLDEIREHGLPPLFAARPELIDALVYKLRVILHELLENGIEHAFHGLEGGALGTYFGVYGRVRRHVLESERKAKWETARRREKSGCPTLGRFNTANNDDWIELFYFDGGRGLLADVDAWAMSARDSGQQGIADAIGGLKSSSNKLGELSKHFFGTALSRVPRTGRTAITGLQHIGLVLASEHDFARACVAREWVGAVHPWKDNVSPGSVNLAKLDEYRKLPEACGTAWHFCVRVHADDVLLPDYWAMREDILEARLPTVDPKQYDTWTIHDERELSGGVRTTDLKTARLGGTAVWLPGDARKQRIFQWLTALRVQTDVKCWLVADIPAYQAVLIAEVLRYERSRLGFPIVLVTDDWRAAYLPEGDRSRNPFVVAEAKRFLSERSADLFVALRAHDSRLFWDGIPNTPNRQSLADIPFVYERVVEWEGSNGAKVTLDGYLELTQALTSPSRSAVCKRAIARTWHFFYPGTRDLPPPSRTT